MSLKIKCILFNTTFLIHLALVYYQRYLAYSGIINPHFIINKGYVILFLINISHALRYNQYIIELTNKYMHIYSPFGSNSNRKDELPPLYVQGADLVSEFRVL